MHIKRGFIIAKTITLTEARIKLMQLADRLDKHPEEGDITLTKYGKPVGKMISAEFYDSLIETREIMSSDKEYKLLKKSIKEAEKGKLIPWDKGFIVKINRIN